MSIAPYIAYLRGKYQPLYGLDPARGRAGLNRHTAASASGARAC